MAAIAKVKRAKGFAYQAKIKRRGRVIKTKTFRTKTAAREWARRIESDIELEIALQDPGRRVRLSEGRRHAAIRLETGCGTVPARWQG
jgi:hypothetical protein